MGDDITIGVTEIVNNIEVTAQPSDQVIEIDVVDNSDDVTLNITPTVIEININKGSSFARWGTILGNLPDQADLQNVLNLKADLVGGLVPASQLPSYVDDIVEVANYAALPVVGETGKIYLTLDNNKIFRWSGSVYIEVAANNAIWGAITGNLSFQTDLQTALDTKALKTTTITINGTSYDLSANRSWTIPTHDAVTIGTANGLSLVGQSLSLGLASSINTGALSAEDWAKFNSKQGALSGTGFVKISGSTISYDNSTYALDSVVVKLTGDQTITGPKRFVGSITNPAIIVTNNTSGGGIASFNTTSGSAFYSSNVGTGSCFFSANSSIGSGFTYTNSGTGVGIIGDNQSTGIGVRLTNASSGKNLILNNTSTGTGMPFSVQKNDVDVATISDTGVGVFSSTVQASAFRLTGMTAGSGALYWTSDRVTLANYNTNGVVEIEALGGASIATFGSAIDFTKTVFVSSNLYANGLISRGTPANTLSYLSGSGAIFIRSLADETAYAFQLNTSSGLDLWSTNSGGTSTRRLTLDSSGNLGIGTTSPNFSSSGRTVTDINGTSQSMLALSVGGVGKGFLFHTGTDLLVSNEGNGSIGFNANGDRRVTILPLGNVGIGESSPFNKLTVNYPSAVIGNSSADGVAFQTSNTGDYIQFLTNLGNYSSIQAGIRGSSIGRNLLLNPSGGNVGIGTTSPAYKFDLNSNAGGISFKTYTSTTNNSEHTYSKDAGFFIDSYQSVGGAPYTKTTDLIANADAGADSQLRMFTATTGGNPTERMRITSGGNVMVNLSGTSAYLDGKLNSFGNSTIPAACFKTESSGQFTTSFWNAASGTVTLQQFVHGTGQSLVGSISSNGSTTSYNITSDYRLKEDLKSINGLDLISKIKIYDFKFKNSDFRMGGVIAHELQEVVPYAVTGEKDAEQMQSVDYSKLVPILVQAIQELKAEIEILKNK